MLKISFDFHGVLDTLETQRKYLDFLNEKGAETWIITGASFEDFKKESEGLNLKYKKFFSVQDYLNENFLYKNIGKNKYGRYMYPDEIWNSIKGAFCEQRHIDYHLDDTEEYAKYFTGKTKFILIRSKKC